MGARLTKTSWVEFGLQQLADNGYHRLKAQTLAKKLGVSRGSFYWHFEDITEFESKVVDLWKTQASRNIDAAVSPSSNPQKNLENLIELSLLPSDIERAIRSWSVVDDKVAIVVSAIDQRRFDLIERVLKDVGIEKSQIESRALLLYWAGVGRTILGNNSFKNLSKNNVANLAALMSK